MENLAAKFLRILPLITIAAAPMIAYGQGGADMNPVHNTNCMGTPCDYSGPSILINELMLSPNSNDGSMWGGKSTQRGEWIELYNPDICLSVDISCFYLGNNANDSDPYPGGYVIPPGTVVPPAGFALIRGVKAPPVPAQLLVENGGNVVELVVSGDGVCVGDGSRLWFPNAGGWFAFYDSDGVPQDAVSWGNQSNLDQYPCTPALAGCGFTGTLPNYDEFPDDRKEFILATSAEDHKGKSIRRIPDGGAWSGPANPTYATCNDDCADLFTLNCTGSATADPQGGTPPYTFLWNDSRAQTTQTAEKLCAGEHCVLITDALGNTEEQCVTIEDVAHEVDVSAGICEGEDYTLPDNTVVTEAGLYPVLFLTTQGCDSLVTFDLAVYPNYAINLDPEICDNQTYTLPDGTEVSDAGTYDVTYQTVHGCDSIYTVILTVNPPIDVPMEVKICPGETYRLPDGTEVSDAGLHEVLMPGGAAACDTLYAIDLLVYPSFQIETLELNDISCFGENDGSISLDIIGGAGSYSFSWSDGVDHGAAATDLVPGDYSVEVTDFNGCKSDTAFEIIEPLPVSITATADELICNGSASDLVAEATGGTGDFTYHWGHTASTGSTETVNPVEDTEYTVFAADENGCETDTVNLEVAVINMYADSLVVSEGDSLCVGEETGLTAEYSGQYPPYTYSWSHGLPNGPGPHVVSPVATTTYTVTVTDDCGNEVTKEIGITVSPLPVIDLTTEDVSCFGLNDGTAQVAVTEGTPDYAFDWSDGVDHGAEASNLEPGDYSVGVTDAHGCKSDAAFEILEPQPVSITAAADDLICNGSASDLVAAATGGTGDFTYHWGHTASTASTETVSPVEDTEYTVFAADENGCETDTVTLGVAVINMYADSLVVSEGDSLCVGEETVLTAEYSGQYPPYAYSWSHGLPNGLGPHVVSPNATTTYTVTVTDDCGNEVAKEIEVFVSPLPVAQMGVVIDVTCFGLDDGTAQISVSDGMPDYAFNWSDGVDHGPLGQGLAPGTYDVEISDAHGCETSISFDISEPPALEIALSGDTLICIGEQAQLFAEATGGTGAIAYHWSHAATNSGQVAVTPNDDTSYTVFAEDANGCTTEPIDIDVAVIAMYPGLLSATNDTTICPGESVSLFGTYTGDYPPYEFQWSGGLESGAGPHVVSPAELTSYELTVSDACGNTLTATVEVDLFEAPIAELPNILLAGCSPLEIELYDSLNTSSGYSHEWVFSGGESHSGNPANLTIEQPGIYEVMLVVTSPDGCSATSSSALPIEVYEVPTADFTASKWSTAIDEPEIIFTEAGQGFTFSEWHIENLIIDNESEVAHTFSDTGLYAVQFLVENEFGCRDSITKWITITITHDVDIPNAFTPSGRGDNPYYDPTGTTNTVFYPFSEYVAEYRMSIFNRWGELIFRSTELEKGWNGTYRDKPAPQDVYVYKIELVYTDGQKATKVGDLTLFR